MIYQEQSAVVSVFPDVARVCRRRRGIFAERFSLIDCHARRYTYVNNKIPGMPFLRACPSPLPGSNSPSLTTVLAVLPM